MLQRAICLVLFVLAACAQDARAAQWLYYSEPEFEVYSDASLTAVTRVARSIQIYEYARKSVLSRLQGSTVLRPRVFVLSRPTYLKYLQSRTSVGGFVHAQDFSVDIVVDATAKDWTGASSVVQHELTHYYMRESVRFALPTWFDEGYAEYLSTIGADDTGITIGRAATGRWVALQHLPWMPLRELFAVARDSEVYRGHRGTLAFYAQSWLLIHYLLSAEGKQDKAHIDWLLTHLDRGEPPDRAVALAFGTDFEAFERRVRKYGEQGRLEYRKFALPKLPEVEPQITRIDERRGLTELALLGLRTGRAPDEDLRALIAQLAQDPSNATAAAAQAYLTRAYGGWQSALDLLARCSAIESAQHRDGMLLCGKAWIAPAHAESGALAVESPEAREAASQARRSYDKAWRADPGDFEALAARASILRWHDEDVASVQADLEAAVGRFPRSMELRRSLAEVYRNRAEPGKARALLESMLRDSIELQERRWIIGLLRDVENELAAQQQP